MDGEQLQRKLQQAVDVMLKSIDTNKMRPLQKKTYMAMANCLDNKNATTQQIDSCVEYQSRGLQISQQIIQQEMNQFQGRLQRCLASCEDSVQDQVPNMRTDQAAMDTAQGLMMKGSAVCVEKNIALLKGIQYKIETDLDKALAAK